MSAVAPRVESLFVPSQSFREAFDKRPFGLQHHLDSHPLFEWPRLAKLAEKILAHGDPQNFTHFAGKGISQGSPLPTRESKNRVAKAIEELAHAGSWIKLTAVQEVDPDYNALLDDLIIELEGLTCQPLRRMMTWRAATIFLASPGTFTPYHIDHNHNFLLQISGSKEVNLFDPMDRSVLSEEEIEQFYVGDDSAAKYKPDSQSKAFVHQLEPCMGVYQPPLAPHWVRNGEKPTIALSVGFCQRPLDSKGRVYQVNHYLRRMGLDPSPLGASPLRDRMKMAAIGLFSTRHPTTYRETIYSGIERIRGVLQAGRRIAPRQPE